MTNKRKKRKEGNPLQNFGRGFNKRDKRRDDHGPYPDSGVNKRKKRKEGNPQQNFGHGFNKIDKNRDDKQEKEEKRG